MINSHFFFKLSNLQAENYRNKNEVLSFITTLYHIISTVIFEEYEVKKFKNEVPGTFLSR